MKKEPEKDKCVMCGGAAQVKLKLDKEVVSTYCYKHSHWLSIPPLCIRVGRHPIRECSVCFFREKYGRWDKRRRKNRKYRRKIMGRWLSERKDY